VHNWNSLSDLGVFNCHAPDADHPFGVEDKGPGLSKDDSLSDDCEERLRHDFLQKYCQEREEREDLSLLLELPFVALLNGLHTPTDAVNCLLRDGMICPEQAYRVLSYISEAKLDGPFLKGAKKVRRGIKGQRQESGMSGADTADKKQTFQYKKHLKKKGK